jgi:hypothetical protein
MSNEHASFGTAQHFVLEQVDLFLGRLEQLGRQIRDTVARIIGTTVAEAVSEAIQLAMRLLPHRRLTSSRRDERLLGESYDSYGDDGYGCQYQEARGFCGPTPPSTLNWRGIVSSVAGFAARHIHRLRSWKIGPWLPLGGVAALRYLLRIPAGTAE